MLNLKKKIAEAAVTAINALYPAASVNAVDVVSYLEYPPDKTMGDLALPCFRFSRELRNAPPRIASAICEYINANSLLLGVADMTLAGGYLNFRVSDEYITGSIYAEIAEKCEEYGRNSDGEGKTVVLDYSSPNVAKPFHIGHLGTTVIGHSLRKLHEFCGYKCIGINHLGDWGTQFGKMIVAYRLWGNREAIEAGGIDELVSLYVRINNEIKAEEEAGKTDLADASRAEFAKLEHGDEENLALWRWFIDISLKEYNVTYGQLGIIFDSYAGESFYTDKMPEQVEKLREMNLLKLDDGASIVDLSEYNMPPCLILKRDGSTLYPTRDIAAAVYRKRTYDFDKCIYVTSAGQSLHFAQWFKVVELMGYDFADKLVHVPYGTVSIGGEKLATRTGNVILLKDLFKTAIEKVSEIVSVKNPTLLEEEKAATSEAVGVGAIIFYYLSANRIRDINFNMDDALNFDGNTGPYAMYTYARTCSVKHKAEADGVKSSVGKVTADEERQLLLTLSRFGEIVKTAVAEYEPSIVTRYILDVCGDFNRFYHNCPILSSDDADVRSFRLGLVEAVNSVLGNALELICMKKTERI